MFVTPLRCDSGVLVPPEETLSPSSESIVILGNISPLGRIVYSLADEAINLSGEAFNLLGRHFHRALRKDLLSSLLDKMFDASLWCGS